MKFFAVGLSYKTAPVEVRERLAVTPSKLGCFACRLKIGAGLSEVVLVSTCNRVEIYAVSNDTRGPADRFFQWINPSDIDLLPYLYFHEGVDAQKHLFAVTSGLDSMVLGETEITGQVKNAYQAACQAKLTGRVLNRVFQAALATAKEVRTRTNIGRGATSVGSAAVELAEKIFGSDLSKQAIMIIGAGKMGEACLRHLSKKGSRTVMVSNRSVERAQALAAEIGGQAVRLEDCLSAMERADIVVSSTGSPEIILNRSQIECVMRARGNRPLALIDIAVPRDIDPDVQFVSNVYLYNIDDLESLARENVRQREQELDKCQDIIERQAAAVLQKLGRRKEPREAIATAEPGWAFSGVPACA